MMVKYLVIGSRVNNAHVQEQLVAVGHNLNLLATTPQWLFEGHACKRTAFKELIDHVPNVVIFTQDVDFQQMKTIKEELRTGLERKQTGLRFIATGIHPLGSSPGMYHLMLQNENILYCRDIRNLVDEFLTRKSLCY